MFAAIRRDARVEDFSIRELARRHGVHRRTVRQALASADPPARKTPTRVAPKLGSFVEIGDAMLVAELRPPRQQPHTRAARTASDAVLFKLSREAYETVIAEAAGAR